MARLNKSGARIALPTFNGEALQSLIGELCRLDQRFIPSEKGYSLYLRPTLFGTQRTLGVGPPGSALLFVIASPVGPYYPTGFKAISLEATDEVLDYLGEQGFDPQFGARPLKRVLQRVILNELSKDILAGKVSKDAVVEAVLEDGEVRFENVELPTV